MNLLELKHYNTVNIYNEILSGKNTINSIAKQLKISNLSVCKLANNLAKKKIIEISAPPRDKVGRRCHIYTPSHKYYSIFIDKQQDAFCVIGISTNGKSVLRFDFDINYEGKTAQDVFDNYVLDEIKSNPNFKFCLAIYLSGINIDEILTDDTVIKASKEEIIVHSLMDKNKIMLFEFDNKLILSIYSHIHYPQADKKSLYDAMPIHELISFTGGLYFETFDALNRITSKKLIEIF